MVEAKIIKHTKAYGEELITVEINLHRFILPEFNTHRLMSRNFQSSRAVPTNKLLDQIKNNPATPVHWGKNQRGMVAENELDEETQLKARKIWEEAAKSAADFAEKMNELKVHKQIVNRLLEPFMWTKGIITNTKKGWDAFFALRVHPDAQPEIQCLANKIKNAIEESTPQVLEANQWHLPYVDDLNEYSSLEEAIKVSVSCCAQVSYRNLDFSVEKALKIYCMLHVPEDGNFGEDPPHFSPCEHQALVTLGSGGLLSPSDTGGNFHSRIYYQYRKMLERGVEKQYIV